MGQHGATLTTPATAAAPAILGKRSAATVRGSVRPSGRKPLEMTDCFRHVASTKAKPKVIAGIAELTSGQYEHALGFYQARRDAVGVRAEESWKSNTAGARTHPRAPLPVALEKRVQQPEVPSNDFERNGQWCTW